MYSVNTTKRFDKQLKRCLKRGLDLQLLYDAIALLRTTGTLPMKYRPHKLVNQKVETWECHIEPDWLLEYQYYEKQLILMCIRVGSHNELFEK